RLTSLRQSEASACVLPTTNHAVRRLRTAALTSARASRAIALNSTRTATGLRASSSCEKAVDRVTLTPLGVAALPEIRRGDGANAAPRQFQLSEGVTRADPEGPAIEVVLRRRERMVLQSLTAIDRDNRCLRVENVRHACGK